LTAASQTRLFEPLTRTWSIAAPLPAERPGHALALLPDGRVVLTGGRVGTTPSAEMLSWRRNAPTWAAGPPMPEGRDFHHAEVLDSGALLLSGAPAMLFEAGAWRAVAVPERASCSQVSMRALGGNRVLVVHEASCFVISQRFTSVIDVASGDVTDLPTDPFGRQSATLTRLPDGRVMMTGGAGSRRGIVDFFKD
jgi:hypothetical protein